MRGAGLIDSARGLGRSDHVCWVYDDRAQFCAAGIEFLREGLELGQRVLYAGVGDGDGDELYEELASLGGVDEHRGRGAIDLRLFTEVYARGSIASQAGVYARATQDALRDGFTGLRVAADATPAVQDPADRAAFVRYEHTVDRLMAGGLPLSAMCAYDRHLLGEEAAAQVACVHPYAHGAATPFRLFATDTDTIALVGEVDADCAGPFTAAIQHALAAHEGADAGVDCAALEFIDQRSLVTMDAVAAATGVTLRLAHLRDGAARMTDLLDLRAVRVA